MKKIVIGFLAFLSFVGITLVKPNVIFAALTNCDPSRLSITYSPKPLYNDFSGNINFTIIGSGLATNAKHRIKIACSLSSNPTSNVGTVSSGSLIVTVSPGPDERNCLARSYQTGAKDINFQTEQGQDICKFPGAFTTILQSTCGLTIFPTIVAPGGTVTISVKNAPAGVGIKLIVDPGGKTYMVSPDASGSFIQNITVPTQEGTYTVKLVNLGGSTTYCSNIFIIQLNPPSPGTSPSPGTGTACNQCGYCPPNPTPPDYDKCLACVSDGKHVWTALGCISTEPSAFVAWLLTSVIGLAGGLAFLLILYGGFQVLSSSGEPEKLNTGKEIIVSALTGLLMIIFSVLLLRVIGYDILRLPGFITTTTTTTKTLEQQYKECMTGCQNAGISFPTCQTNCAQFKK